MTSDPWDESDLELVPAQAGEKSIASIRQGEDAEFVKDTWSVGDG